ncbi:hypothetical protein [Paenibacillus cymbidii]|uniref:hypothetical protein n=1 Tax=Paenibacillus cymbidii TaxID=1639034 RepID=UPI001081B731|nr:hypothetical protein [Paenibacillus cymbidii]
MARSSFEGFIKPRPDKNGTNTGDANAIAAHLLDGESAYVKGKKVVGTMANQSSVTVPVSTVASSTIDLFARIPFGAYLTADSSGYPVIKLSDSNFDPSNIPNGMLLFGMTGNGGNVKRYAQGTATSDGSGDVTVSGLSFKPSFVYVSYTSSSNQWKSVGVDSSVWTSNRNAGFYLDSSNNSISTTPVYSSNGFTIRFVFNNAPVYWIAFE